ncbi:hypothetical protein LT980_07065 [Citrobacter portucalensis]|uniref:hypothetical protein n=1 Tax=Citrobacter portucalensis TaxID=1639133 RepID=UPI00202CAEED|nr:hypothetical protein [Citrobacter portucalensis]URR14345.1 hypothetical protein LT980_07065 [Citrobacter portucalensis]
MEEQDNKILVELLQKAVGGIDAAVSFSQAQIPDIVHQLLVWNFVSSALAMIVGLVISCGMPLIARSILIRYGKAKVKDETWVIDQSLDYTKSMSCPAFIALLFCSVAFIISVLVVINSMDWLKIWLTPKLYLLEYAASLIK